MERKPFHLGILVGRFQTFHAGHEQMIRTAISLCDQVGIFIGSSQEQGTSKNPFSYELRSQILERVFGDRVQIWPLPDIGVGNTGRWGEYVLKNVVERFGTAPDLLVSGKESRRLDWFDTQEGVHVAELYLPKTIDISATVMREHLIRGDREAWQEYTNPILWEEFEILRQGVLAAKDNLFTTSV